MASSVMQMLSAVLCLAGAFFFLAGTVGLLRFPDSLSRIHALTKADNLGLGLIALALALVSDSSSEAVKIMLIWLLALAASSSICFLVGQSIMRKRKTGRT